MCSAGFLPRKILLPFPGAKLRFPVEWSLGIGRQEALQLMTGSLQTVQQSPGPVAHQAHDGTADRPSAAVRGAVAIVLRIN